MTFTFQKIGDDGQYAFRVVMLGQPYIGLTVVGKSSRRVVLAAVSTLMVALAFGLREDRPAKADAALRPQNSTDALQEAFRTQGFRTKRAAVRRATYQSLS